MYGMVTCFLFSGVKVVKKSGKPFKSKNKVNTVKEVVFHPEREGELAYTFYEDDSYVSVELCEIKSFH